MVCFLICFSYKKFTGFCLSFLVPSANWGFAWFAGEAVQGIWLARVRPEDCENVIKYTVLQGKVVKPERQLRGGFNRETGMVSW